MFANLRVRSVVSVLIKPDSLLTRSELAARLITFADRPSLRSLAGHCHRVSWKASPLTKGAYLISSLEQGAGARHGVHDDGEAAGERDLGFLETAPLGDFERPDLQCKGRKHPLRTAGGTC